MDVLKARRIRVRRDTPQTGVFEWVPDAQARPQRWAPGDPELSGDCEVIVPAEMVALQTVEVPAAQAERISGALRFLIEDRLISEPERTHVAATRCARNALCTAAIDRDWFKAVLQRLRQAGLSPRAAYPECLLPPVQSGAWNLVCDSDAFVRAGEWSGFALGSLEHAQGVLRVAIAADPPQRIILRPAPGEHAPDPKAWAAALGVPVEVGAPWHWSSDSARSALDLLQGDFAAVGRDGGRFSRLGRAAALALALVVVGSAGLGLDWLLKSRERSALLAEMQRIHRETLGESVPFVDPPAQLRQHMDDLLRRSGRPAPGDFLPLMAAFSDVALGMPTNPARIQHLTYDGTTLTLVLQPADAKRLAAMPVAARRVGLDVRVEELQWSGKPAVRAQVSEAGGRWSSSAKR